MSLIESELRNTEHCVVDFGFGNMIFVTSVFCMCLLFPVCLVHIFRCMHVRVYICNVIMCVDRKHCILLD